MKGAVAVTLLAALPATMAALTASSLKVSSETLTLPASFDPIQAAYWTGLPHHRRTPFAVSPDGKSAFLAFLNAAKDAVYVQPVDPTTFAANGDGVKIAGAKEAAGLVAHNDGFAVLVTQPVASGAANAPPNSYPITNLIRYKNGAQAWSTPLNGPGVHVSDGLSATPDANGDLVYSAESGLYGAYFVVTAYSGWAEGHFGDSIQYVNDAGALQSLPQSSSWGCSHNTGIAFEAASAPPFASVCAEDHGAIWLNTDTRSMNGIKIANENVTNGVSGEPMGGMSGSYSNLAALDSGRYIFAWQSRGAVSLTQDDWMGKGFTQASPRWLNHNVAIATMDAKNKLAGSQAVSNVGAASGDDQVTWITKESGTDHQNVRVASAGSGQLAVVTWEQLTSPKCEPVPLSCSGTFGGTFAQLVDATGTGSKVGEAINLGTDVTISGDIVTIGSKICWPFVKQTWDLSRAKSSGTAVTKMSFACLSTDGSVKVDSTSAASTTAAASTTIAASTTSVAAEPTLTAAAEPTSTAAAEPTTTEAPAAEPTTTEVPAAEPTEVAETTVEAPEVTTEAPEPTSTAAAEPATTDAAEPTTTEAPAPESTEVAEPTSGVPEATTEAPEATSEEPEVEPTTVAEPTSVATEAPEPTTAPEIPTTEPAAVASTASSTRRFTYRPTKHWGRPHHTLYTSPAGQQAQPTGACY